MIVYDLKCATGHVFEAWFGSGDDFAGQKTRGLIACPLCGSGEVEKAPSALAIGGKAAPHETTPASPSQRGHTARNAETETNAGPSPEAVKAMLSALAKAQKEAVAKSDYVGSRFAEEARAMHYGEQTHRSIYGETKPQEARSLREEGVEAMPLLFPVRPRSDA